MAPAPSLCWRKHSPGYVAFSKESKVLKTEPKETDNSKVFLDKKTDQMKCM